jgi:hypothetical protein
MKVVRSLSVFTLCGVLIAIVAPAAIADDGQDSGDQGNMLIADQYNNRIVEVDRKTHKVVWQFGNGSDKPGPDSVVGPNDAERIGPFTLISGTGIPPSNPPLPGCSDPTNGCPDNRVMIVDPSGHIVWQYGMAGVSGSGANQLNTPVQALAFFGSFNKRFGQFVVITDQANERVIVVNSAKQIVWQYGTTGVAGNGPNQLSNPNSAELLENGNVLIADENNNRVIEVTIGGQIVHQLTAGGTISGAAFASRLPGGNTLISDSNNNRIVEVDPVDNVVWQYATNLQSGSNSNPLPTRAVRLRNGHTLISDQYNNRVLEIDRHGHIVFQQGALNVPGNGFDRLNGPYDAKVIGDFTGLTPPFYLH